MVLSLGSTAQYASPPLSVPAPPLPAPPVQHSAGKALLTDDVCALESGCAGVTPIPSELSHLGQVIECL